MNRLGVLGAVVMLGSVMTTPASAQVRAETAEPRVTVTRAEPMELEKITPGRFERLADGQVIVHRGLEITAGELRRRMQVKAERMVVMSHRSADAAQLRLEARRLEYANESEGLAEAQIAAAEAALAELRSRNRIIRRTR